VRYTVSMDHAWLGLAWHPDGKRLYSSGAAQDAVYELTEKKGRLAVARTIAIARPAAAGDKKDGKEKGFVGGVAVSPDGSTLYAVHVLGTALSSVDLESGGVVATRKLSAEPYTCLVSSDGAAVYVSLWGGARVLVFDAKTLEPKGEIAVGEHPNAMAFSRDGRRLFVACANTNSVWAIDLERRAAAEQISVALYPGAPAGSTPNALDVSPDGKTLLAANADNNAVAVVDISRPGDSRVQGFIPTGWYPTGVRFSRDGSKVYVLSGKGLTSQANPRGGHPGIPGPDGQYIGRLLQGSLSVLPCPDPAALPTATRHAWRRPRLPRARRSRPR